ncbi:MAG: hypothetical protein JNJ54_35015 [Myxococcaceae bacterium]|nr:hypothetical protein [Myxococcaceae bacterium]
MAMRIGNLFVSLSADTSGFSKSMQDALKSVEKFSREVKKAANDAAQVAGSITAVGVAALKLASDVSGPTKRAMDELNLSMKQAAKPVAEALVPAVREASSVIRGLGDAFAQLSPETKAMVGDVFKAAAAITAVSLVVGRLATLSGTLAGVFSGVAGAIAAIGVGPLLAVLAVLAAVSAGIAVLHRAWRENWGGIQQVAARVAQWFADTWADVTGYVTGLFGRVIDGFAGTMKAGILLLARFEELIGNKDVARAMRGSLGVIDAVAADMKSGAAVKRMVVAAVDLGKAAAGAYKDEWSKIFDELGLKSDSLKSRFSKSVPLTVGKAAPGAPYPVQAPNMVSASNQSVARAASVGGPRGSRLSQLSPAVASPEAMKGAQGALDAQQAAAEASAAMQSSIAGTAQAFVAKLGEAGGIVSNVINAGVQGGPWAAVAAGLAELLAKTQAFTNLMNVAGGGLELVIQALEPAARDLLGALGEVLAPAFQAVANVVTAVSPILNVVASVVRRIAPILVIVGHFLSMLAPLFSFIATILEPLVAVLEVVMRILFEITRVILTVVGALATAIVAVWNTLLDAIAGIVDTVIAIFTAGTVRNAGDFVRQGKASTKAFHDALAAMTLTNYDAAMAVATKATADEEAAAAATQVATSFRDFGETLTNVPSGYKVAYQQYAAADGAMNVYGSIEVYVTTPVDGNALQAMKAQLERLRSQKRGRFSDTGE